MRRALLLEWPALTAIYGIHPWHVDERPTLTFDELEQYRIQAENIVKWRAR